MSTYYDDLETRSHDAREAAQAAALGLSLLSDLAALPVLRKSDLSEKQRTAPPFGGLVKGAYAQVFQSPGPIYEPGGISHDWWRFGRFLHAAGIGADDIVQNCLAIT